MLQNDLYSWLTTDVVIAPLFPGGVHHMAIPQDVETWPAMAFQQVSQVEIAEDMEQPNDAKIDQVLYQFTITADSSADVITAADTLNDVFRNFRGTMGASNIQTINIGNISHLEEQKGDKLRRAVVMDYSINLDA
jgi:hypothetical protein